MSDTGHLFFFLSVLVVVVVVGGSGQFFMFSFNLIFIHFLKPFFSIYDLFSFIPSFIHSFLVYIFLIYDQYLNKKHVKTFTFTFTFNEATGYLEMPTRLRESVQRKRSELWPDKRCFHHYNASVHDVIVLCEFLVHRCITEMS